MNTIGQISEINFEIGEIFISEWTRKQEEMIMRKTYLNAMEVQVEENRKEHYELKKIGKRKMMRRMIGEKVLQDQNKKRNEERG